MADSPSSSPPRQKSPKRHEPEEDDSHNCLYIGNIEKEVDNDKLTQIFSKYGELEYCFLVYQPLSKDHNNKEVRRSRGYGFAKFVKGDDMKRAKTELDGFEIFGRRLKVEFSKRNKPREATPGRYLGKKKQSPPRNSGHRDRRRSYSRSSSDDSYHRRRRHQKKDKHRSRHERDSRSRDRGERDDGYRRRKRSFSGDKDRRRRD